MKHFTIIFVLLYSVLSFSAQEYVFYDSWEGAEQSRQFLFNQQKLDSRDEEKPILPQDAPEDYQRVNNILIKVMNSFRKLYPLKTENLKNIPHLIIVNKDVLNAYVNVNYSKKYYYIIITSGSLTKSDETIAGILAHELAHLLIEVKSSIREERLPKTMFYNSHSIVAPRHNEIRASVELTEKAQQWMFYSNYVGGFTLATFEAITFDSYLTNTSLYHLEWEHIYKNSKKPECLQYLKKYRHFLDLHIEYQSYETPTVHQQLIQLYPVVNQLKKSCLNFKVNIVAELGKLINFDEEKTFNYLVSQMLSKNYKKEYLMEMMTYFKNYNLGEATIKTNTFAKQKMRIIERSMDFKNIRHYTREDYADEVAIKILHDLKIPYKNLFRDLAKKEASTADKCDTLPTVEPSYGLLSSIHHEPCWRFWRAGKVHKATVKDNTN